MGRLFCTVRNHAIVVKPTAQFQKPLQMCPPSFDEPTSCFNDTLAAPQGTTQTNGEPVPPVGVAADIVEHVGMMYVELAMSSYEKVMEEYDEAIAVQAAIDSAPQAPAASIPPSALAPSQGSEVVKDEDPSTPPGNCDQPSTFYNAWPQASGDELKQGLPVQSLASSQGDGEQMHEEEKKMRTTKMKKQTSRFTLNP